jgi:hypothetical protein
MRIKATIAAVAILLLTQSAIAQFGQFGQGRLSEYSNRLANEAAELAENSYRQSNDVRSSRNDVAAMMAAQQFSASAQLFNRMVNDRRRNQDLRDAFQLLQDSSRALERYNLQRNSSYNIQRLMSDIGGELNVGGNGKDNDNRYPDSGRSSGRMTWKGRVDDDVRITIRGGTADVQTIGGTAYNNATQSFSASLPSRRVNVTLQVRKARGEVFIEQQPSRENNFAAVIHIRDPKGGASDYEFELSW